MVGNEVTAAARHRFGAPLDREETDDHTEKENVEVGTEGVAVTTATERMRQKIEKDQMTKKKITTRKRNGGNPNTQRKKGEGSVF